MREKHTSKVKILLTMMETSAKSLSNLISDVLDLSKIEARKLELKMDSFNPIQTIEEVVNAFSPQAHKKELELGVDVTGVKYNELYCDESRFTQIFNNLLDNAVKFTVNGGVYITAKTEEINNEIRLIVDITDTGIGIDEEAQSQLFQAFMQSEHVKSNHIGGTGLGLSISHRLCQLLGGSNV
ncbi:sensor histidine kinase [Psychrosphaera algicola]|uniref:histidine kinase n=1 Tax=Psychrosphaera algicola TaxID=3023714 RepID=A0ABT5FA45_9GAMM|nr:ATP-binding protein [Psychrosphaera sp. G1-22]MDC2888406.1 ATP-binding protein [Psychrosphaera sp. G1-22]